MFRVRNQPAIARFQFVLAGVNAHINHDLPLALAATCRVTGTIPRRGTGQYRDDTGLNTTLDSLVDQAKHELNVRLPGDQPPPVSHHEKTSPPGVSRPHRQDPAHTRPMAFPATT